MMTRTGFHDGRTMNRTLIVVAVLFSFRALAAALPQRAEMAPLVHAPNLVYQGSFRVPAGNIGSSSFDYGGTAIAFNPDRQSLFVVGHDWHQHVAEIAIPDIRKSKDVTALATARVLQPFADATDGGLGAVGAAPVKVGGLLAYQGRLYLTAYVFFDANGSQRLSHYVSGLDLSAKGDTRGPFQVGSVGAGFVSGYFGLVPAAWRDALGGPVLNGQCCLNIITRTSFGPAAFAIDPAAIGGGASAPAVPLVYYPAAHPLLEPGTKGDGWSTTSTLFNGTSEVKGIVFPERTRSVLFFGRQGLGPFCYGPGTADKNKAGQPATDIGDTADKWCYDPALSMKGTHAYPYEPYVWAYDAIDLAAVKRGEQKPWDVKPYGVWKLNVPFATPNARLTGAAYDPRSGRIFVPAAFSDGDRPVVHVFTVAASASASE
jgi:hypothetical protein